MAIKLANITTQEQLDAAIEKVRAESKSNFEEAAVRTQAKLEALEANNKEYQKHIQELTKELDEVAVAASDLEAQLQEAYSANDTYELADMLAEHQINPKFNDLVIQAGGLHSGMDEEEFKAAIAAVKEGYPEFAVNEKQPTTSPDLDEGAENSEFDTNKTYQ